MSTAQLERSVRPSPQAYKESLSGRPKAAPCLLFELGIDQSADHRIIMILSTELARGAKPLVRMEGNNTYLDPPEATSGTSRSADKETKSFAFDKSYWSAGPKDEPGYASQQTLYEDLGRDLLDHSFQGFNTCIFAYGQTGSGKSYSMMGYGSDRGIIPLICEALFERITSLSTDKLSFTVEVSYTEIYQEKVRDLLNPSNKGNLKVREHPSLGPYVEGLSKLAVQSFPDIEALMDEGTKARTVAATNMNETSSRSHAVFTLLLTQRRLDVETGMAGEKVSRISLVDLAGSERANSTGATGTRLKEGALINKSLTTLGRVIAALAAASGGGKHAGEKVPYRDSVLTWLLKDSLGGNSKTAMVAAISPADYEETLSTLRYADQAKKIKNKAVVNEDPNAKLIRELKEELATLRTRMTGASNEATYDPDIPAEQQIVSYRTQAGEIKTITKAELQDQLEQSERLMASVTETWEEKLVRTQEVQKEREQALEALGITIEKNQVGVHTPKKMPHLVNLNEDPLMSECLIYQIKLGKTTVGNLGSEVAADIRLSGSNILAEHCYFESSPDGKVVLHTLPGSLTMVNGRRISVDQPRELRSGFRIILGDFHVFRFNHPEEVRKARDAVHQLRSPLSNDFDNAASKGSPAGTRPESPMSTAEADWSYARREAVVARLNGQNVNLDKLKDEELNRLYADILKVRHSRTASSVTSGDRPDSRMSLLDSVHEGDDDEDEPGEGRSGRPYSGGTWSTGPTSYGDLDESTLTLSRSPDLGDRVQAFKDEYETKLQTMADANVKVEVVTAEKAQMEAKLRSLEAKMIAQKNKYDKKVKRLKSTKSSNEVPSDDDEFDSTPLTPRELRLARNAIQRWRRCQRVRMAEDTFSQAVLVKEANAISRELKKGTTFQFVVIERDIPSSVEGAIVRLAEFEASSDPTLATCHKPCIGVKVLDRRHRMTSIWTLTKLQHRMQLMRNLFKWVDNPEYSQHFAWQDPFYESEAERSNGFSYVGSATVSLAPLSRNLPATNVVQIHSPYTADPMGTCRVRIKPLSIETPDTPSVPLGRGTHPSIAAFVEGSKLSFEVIVDRVIGMSKSDFVAVHLQLSASSFFIKSPGEDDEFVAGDAVNLISSLASEIRLRHTFSVVFTAERLRELSEGYAPISFFAKVTPAHLDKIERWDEARDSSTSSKIANAPSLRGDPENGDVTRRHEDDLIVEQTHDVLAKIEIRELGESGNYESVVVVSSNPLDSGAFFLRQGLQRRIVIHLSHNSGRAWQWKRVAKVSLGDVRMLDARGRVHAATSAADVDLRGLGNPRAGFTSDGVATLNFAAAWDSSVHDSPHLNRSTPSGSRVLVRLHFQVSASNCSEPIPFSMDIGVTVQNRDARGPSKLMNLLGASRLSSSVTNVFSVRLTPCLTKNPTEIWRLNTAEMYVRGEELLANWRPRGLSLIRDYERGWKATIKAADVEAAKAVLAAFELTLPSPVEGRTSKERLAQAVELWQKRFGAVGEISFEREPSSKPSAVIDLAPPPMPSPSLIVTPPRSPRLSGTTTLVPRSEMFSKRGWVALLRDPTSNKWKKYWLVLRRPYLYLYEHSNELDETMVINVSSVRIEQSPEIGQMLEVGDESGMSSSNQRLMSSISCLFLQRQFAFAIFTHQNSYFLSTSSMREMIDWIKIIDPSLAAS
ncbi:BQ2448_3362 [Microbotryum intermedium]|uniref:BQ2448_3362 protein n=1 Tax=Microbotryum intermedium TaxID=269621 RepID=A0A238F9T3_9BASI|nr:BQ2448_3362 [Microbotryum intermedium]